MRVRIQLVDEIVAELMEQYPTLFSVPTDIDALIKQKGIRLVEMDFSTVSGAALVEGDMRIISINGEESEVRKRFTKAHELGHHLLHTDKPLSVDLESVETAIFLRDHDSTTGEDWREIEANRFAAAILMPKSLVRDEITKIVKAEKQEELITLLAKRFNVSTQAIGIRLGSLGY